MNRLRCNAMRPRLLTEDRCTSSECFLVSVLAQPSRRAWNAERYTQIDSESSVRQAHSHKGALGLRSAKGNAKAGATRAAVPAFLLYQFVIQREQGAPIG